MSEVLWYDALWNDEWFTVTSNRSCDTIGAKPRKASTLDLETWCRCNVMHFARYQSFRQDCVRRLQGTRRRTCSAFEKLLPIRQPPALTQLIDRA